MRFILVLLLYAIPLRAQTSGAADTSGPCSPAVTGNDNQFKITCDGIGEAQGKELLKILNRISKEQLDPKLVMQKLDEIEKGVSDLKTGLAKKEEQEAETERIRHTAPIIAVGLTSVPDPGKVMVYFESKNLVPFEYRYLITTEDNLVISGVPLSFNKVYPKNGPKGGLFYSVDQLQWQRIKNNYLEIRFTFQSLSYEELRLPGHSATIIRKYRIGADGALLPLDNDQPEVIPHP
jgi:hypothetical protein